MHFLRKIFLVLIALSSIQKVEAQAPGYMGKRVVAGYGFYFNPGFGNIALNYSDSPFNTLHELFLEYSTKKRVAIGGSLQLYRYIYNNVRLTALNGQYSAIYKPEGSYTIKGNNFKFYGKFYKSSYLAPWGKYFLLGLVINKYTASYNTSEMYLSGVTYPGSTFASPPDFGPTNQIYLKTDFFVGAGNSRIFADRFVFDYGYNINVVALTGGVLKGFIDFNESRELTVDEYISETSLNRMWAVNRFNFFFKIGYLF
jgi:hypothetical protein